MIMSRKHPLKCYDAVSKLLKLHIIAHDDDTCEYRDRDRWDDTRIAEAVEDETKTQVSPGWVWGVRKSEYGDLRGPRDSVGRLNPKGADKPPAGDLSSTKIVPNAELNARV